MTATGLTIATLLKRVEGELIPMGLMNRAPFLFEQNLAHDPRINQDLLSKDEAFLRLRKEKGKSTQWLGAIWGRGGIEPHDVGRTFPAMSRAIVIPPSVEKEVSEVAVRMAKVKVEVGIFSNSLETLTEAEEYYHVMRPLDSFEVARIGGGYEMTAAIEQFDVGRLVKLPSTEWGSMAMFVNSYTMAYPVIVPLGRKRIIRGVGFRLFVESTTGAVDVQEIVG